MLQYILHFYRKVHQRGINTQDLIYIENTTIIYCLIYKLGY